jgi:DNA-binding Lrp family transcriptional regulator
MKIDSTDIQIMKLLQDHANRSSDHIARSLHISPATVRRRINKLIKSQVIREIIYVDPRKLGGNVPVVMPAI